MGNENICIICLQDFGNKKIKLNCNHYFHRKCINKWHKFPMGTQLTQEQQDYIVELIMKWIKKQFDKSN